MAVKWPSVGRSVVDDKFGKLATNFNGHFSLMGGFLILGACHLGLVSGCLCVCVCDVFA